MPVVGALATLIVAPSFLEQDWQVRQPSRHLVSHQGVPSFLNIASHHLACAITPLIHIFPLLLALKLSSSNTMISIVTIDWRSTWPAATRVFHICKVSSRSSLPSPSTTTSAFPRHKFASLEHYPRHKNFLPHHAPKGEARSWA